MKTYEDEFSFSADNAAPCAAACPLARIPESVWRHWLRPPFRKRRPWLFRLGILLLALAALSLALAGREDGFGDDRIALVSISGPILDISSDLEWVRNIANNPRVKGVLLRVDSPGGGAAASQELYAALKDLATTRPLAVSMGGTAASGGVMAAMAGSRVFANPSTVTGSIGVRMDIPQIGDLLRKIGIGRETLTTAPYKDAGSPLTPLTPEQRAYFKDVLDDMHAQFVDIVAAGRAMPREKAAALADGRIFTGREALRLGLVDELGGQMAALRWLAGACGVPAERPLLRKPDDGFWLERRLKSCFAPALSTLDPAPAPVFLYQIQSGFPLGK